MRSVSALQFGAGTGHSTGSTYLIGLIILALQAMTLVFGVGWRSLVANLTVESRIGPSPVVKRILGNSSVRLKVVEGQLVRVIAARTAVIRFCK